MNKRLVGALVTVSLLFVFCLVSGLVYISRPANRTSVTDVAVITDTLNYESIIKLPSLSDSEKGFTCTGLTYDLKRNSFWLGNYGKTHPSSDENKQPSLVQLDAVSGQVKSQIIIEDEGADIQGVSYDKSTDTLWYTDGKQIINSTAEGEIIKKLDIGKYKRYKPNGVLYDMKTDSIWVLCFYNYLLNFDAQGNLLNAYRSDFMGQDHLCCDSQGRLYFSVGIDYNGEDNFVAVYSTEKNSVEYAIRVAGSYSIEGICIVDSYLYVANDGYYHDAAIPENYIAKYKFSF